MSNITKKKIITYKGRSKPYELTVYVNGEVYDFVTQKTTKLGLVLNETEHFSHDETEVETGYMTFDSNGKVVFDLGLIPNPPELKTVGRLIAYSEGNTVGLPIYTEKTNFRLEFEFV